MAYNKGVELQNKINTLSRLILVMTIIKFVFYFYSFLSFMFWLFNFFEFQWLELFNWLFIIPYRLVILFYHPKGLGADFSLAIIGVLSLIFGLIFEFLLSKLYPSIYNLQEALEKYLEQKKTAKPRRSRHIPMQAYSRENTTSISEMYDDKLLLVYIIQPHVHKIKNKPNDLELTFQEADVWRQRVNKRILGNINYSQPIQKGYYRKNLFLVYKDFNYVDDFIYYIQPTIDSIVLEFQKYGIDVQFNHVLSAASQMSNVEKELDLMDTILSLNFINTFILTKKFKEAYDIKNVKQHVMILKGEYNLSKNLSISNIQPLYVFKNEGDVK